jgi:hypothetical protein
MSDENCRPKPTEMHETCCDPAKPSRRGLLAAGVALGVGAGLLDREVAAAGTNATLERLKRAERDPARRVLLKGGTVLSLDPQVGDFERGDVLIEGKKILAVGRADRHGSRRRCRRDDRHAGLCRYPPSPVRNHSARHSRRWRPRYPNDGKKTYQGVIQGVFTPVY